MGRTSNLPRFEFDEHNQAPLSHGSRFSSRRHEKRKEWLEATSCVWNCGLQAHGCYGLSHHGHLLPRTFACGILVDLRAKFCNTQPFLFCTPGF